MNQIQRSIPTIPTTPPLARGAFAGVVLLAIVAACGPTSGDLGTIAPPTPSGAASLDVPSAEATADVTPAATAGETPGAATPAPSPGATTTVRAYFMLGSHTGSGGLAPVLLTIPKTQEVGAAAMAQLLAGPVGGELTADPAMFTDIPEDARFLGLTVADGLATVNLSSEFAAGGTYPALEQRYGQVVFTLTQFATVKTVQFELDGVPAIAVDDHALEGIPHLPMPVGRSSFVSLLPAIFVDRPAWGGAISNPARTTGLANVFEAQFRVRLLAASGATLADVPVLATCGSGCWGTFDVSVAYTVPASQWGTLRVYDISEASGKPVDVTEYPVWLTPRS